MACKIDFIEKGPVRSQWTNSGDACGGHAGKLADAVSIGSMSVVAMFLALDGPALHEPVVLLRKHQLCGDNLLRIEAERPALHFVESARHHTGGNQKKQ